jgi:thiamine biosynthesis lipoprotein
MSASFGRRRFLTILAAAGGWSLPRVASAGRAGSPSLYSWRGTALGADAAIEFFGVDADAARGMLAACVGEIRRVEALFSTFRPDSVLARLNRDGRLEQAPAAFLKLIGTALEFAELTNGFFDPTVQPLWDLYAGHFAAAGADAGGPASPALERTRALVDFRRVTVSGRTVAFAGDGTAVTLNGMAQGYLTDRITAVLKAAGVTSALIETGEIYALGRHIFGRPWRVGLRDATAPTRLARTVALADRAIATSAAYGTPFEPTGRHHHLFDPFTGRSAGNYRSVSVASGTATAADALSTALYAMPLGHAFDLIDLLDGVQVWFTLPDGRTISYGKS